MKTFDDFVAEWLVTPPRRVIDPLLIGNGETADTAYQCVSLIKQYWVECFNLVINYPGNAIDIWNSTPATAMADFDRVSSNNTQRGDIVVLNGVSGNPYGHIGISMGNDSDSDIEILEQNGQTGGGTGTGGDAIRTRSIDKTRVAGLLRPKPTAIASTAPMYTLQPFDPHEMVLTSNASIWDLTTPTANVAVGNYDNGYQFNAQGKALHQDGRFYYMPDVTVPHGFLDENCIDYLPPAPAPVTTTSLGSYIPTSVKPAQTYTLVTTVNTYDSAGYAATGVSPSGTFPAGSYYVYDHQNDLYLLNISNTAQKASCKWVNSKDNVEPVKEPAVVADTSWKGTFAPFDAVNYTQARDGVAVFQPTVYVMESGYRFKDESGYTNTTVPCSQYAEVPMSGIFTKDGKQWLRVYVEGDKDWQRWYAVPMTNPTNGLPYALLEKQVYNDTTTTSERIALKRPTPYDRFILLGTKMDKWYSKAYQTIDGFFKRKDHKN